MDELARVAVRAAAALELPAQRPPVAATPVGPAAHAAHHPRAPAHGPEVRWSPERRRPHRRHAHRRHARRAHGRRAEVRGPTVLALTFARLLLPLGGRLRVQEGAQQLLLLAAAAAVPHASDEVLDNLVRRVLEVQGGVRRFPLLGHEVHKHVGNLLAEAGREVAGGRHQGLVVGGLVQTDLGSHVEVGVLSGRHEDVDAVVAQLEHRGEPLQEGRRARLAHGPGVEGQAPLALELLLEVVHGHLHEALAARLGRHPAEARVEARKQLLEAIRVQSLQPPRLRALGAGLPRPR
mmetsp:Transcript_72393/g.212423  ORF Transcript_72393/g.212423 Transcript_72393/m.212423 type:complete len:293 (+) Transcript_72393:92-970(+)